MQIKDILNRCSYLDMQIKVLFHIEDNQDQFVEQIRQLS
jgi:hypothetical protein